MKNNRLVRLVSLSLLTFTPACGSDPGPAPEVLASRPLDPNGKTVTLLWSLEDSSCAQIPDLTSMHVQIDNEPLEQQGSWPCNARGQDGVTLTRFSPGHYSYALSTYRREKTTASYRAEGRFDVGTEDVVVHVKLKCFDARYGCQ